MTPYEELVEFIASLNPREVVAFRPSENARQSVWDVIERQKSASLPRTKRRNSIITSKSSTSCGLPRPAPASFWLMANDEVLTNRLRAAQLPGLCLIPAFVNFGPGLSVPLLVLLLQ